MQRISQATSTSSRLLNFFLRQDRTASANKNPQQLVCRYIHIHIYNYIYIYVHQYMIYSYEHQMSSMSKQWKTWSEMVWIVSWKNLEIYVSSTRSGGRVKTWHQGVQTPIIWLAVSTYLNKLKVTRNHHPIKTEHTWNRKSVFQINQSGGTTNCITP